MSKNNLYAVGMLTQTQIDLFHRTGFLKIPGVFSGKELEELRQAAAEVEQAGIARTDEDHLYRRLDNGEQAYFRSEKLWERHAIFRAATVHPGLLTAIGQVIGHPFMPWNDSLVSKQPFTETPIPFHQDPPYFRPSITETFGVPDFVTDIYLEASTVANGCVHGLPGRHLVGTIDLKPYDEDWFFTEAGAEPMEMQPGDVLFHALSAPHGSQPNTTADKRTTFYLKYNAQEIEDWKDPATRSMSYDAEGIAKVQGFLRERAEMGFDADLGSELLLDASGFSYTGSTGTPPWHWRTLDSQIPVAEREGLRDLRKVVHS